MPKFSQRDGQCLCGSVKVTASKAQDSVGVCHCSMCRKRAGGPFFAIDCGSDVSFQGQENIAVYNSSDWADRGFCKQCGSNLFYRLKDKNHYFVSMGLFPDDGNFVFDHEVFVDEKPKCYDFKNSTKKMTGAEVFAQFS